MYHSIQNVSKTEPMRSLHVSPAAFKKQLQILKILGFRGCTVSEAVNALREGSKEKIVALTFDDGYQNFLSMPSRRSRNLDLRPLFTSYPG